MALLQLLLSRAILVWESLETDSGQFERVRTGWLTSTLSIILIVNEQQGSSAEALMKPTLALPDFAHLHTTMLVRAACSGHLAFDVYSSGLSCQTMWQADARCTFPFRLSQ
jgi:hypothetical protein